MDRARAWASGLLWPLGQVAMSNLDVALHSTSASVDHAASLPRSTPLSLFATSICHRKPSSYNGFGWV